MEIDEDPAPSRPQPGAMGPETERKGPPIIDVERLVAGGREAILIHDGQQYRLRITANDKLILTK